MRLSKTIGILGKTIGIESIISSIITVVLILGVVAGIFTTKSNYAWKDMIKESSSSYEELSHNKIDTNKLNEDIEEFYKSSRILYGYSDIDDLSLENYSSNKIMLYGWDENNSKRLDDAINNILEKEEILKDRTSFNKKEKEVIINSLKMIRYFCNNQQVINKVRLEMKLIGASTQSNSSLNITVINNGGKDYFQGYEEKLNSLKEIFN